MDIIEAISNKPLTIKRIVNDLSEFNKKNKQSILEGLCKKLTGQSKLECWVEIEKDGKPHKQQLEPLKLVLCLCAMEKYYKGFPMDELETEHIHFSLNDNEIKVADSYKDSIIGNYLFKDSQGKYWNIPVGMIKVDNIQQFLKLDNIPDKWSHDDEEIISRDDNLQKDAEKIAEKNKTDTSQLSKRDIANELSKTDKWKGISAVTIERIITVTW